MFEVDNVTPSDVIEKESFINQNNAFDQDSVAKNMDIETISKHDSNNGDEDYLMDEYNLIDDFVVDMKAFQLNIDHNVESVGGNDHKSV